MAEEAATTEAESKTVSEKVQKVIDLLKDFTLLELKELKDVYEETFGVQAAGVPMGMMPMGAPGGAGAEAAAEEPTSFHVVLKEIGPKKIQVIKSVRELTSLGLKEAKELVDSVNQGPAKIKENVDKDEGEAAVKKVEEAGGVVELEPA